jgi:excisionase family DNA binding protein
VHSVAHVDQQRCAVTQEMHSTGLDRRYTTDAEWLTAEEAAAHLKVKTRTLLLWVRQKKIRGYVLSGIKRRVWRFRRADLDTTLLAKDASVL